MTDTSPSSPSGVVETRRSSDQTRPKVPRSRNGCKACKASRKKCDEVRPACARCAKRSLECVYDTTRRHQINVAPNTPRRRESVSDPRDRNQDSQSGTPNAISNYIDPTLGIPLESGQQWSYLSGDGWNHTDGTRKVPEDLAGSLRFIESAFPRVSHVSPNSATGSDTLPLGEGAYNISNYEFGADSPSGAHLELWRHEQTYLKAFQEEFWPIIARKEEEPSPGELHFAQLSLFEPLRHAIIAVGSAWKAQTSEASSTQQQYLDESIRYHSKAVRGLKISIGRQDRSPWNSIIACTFCLLFYELLRDDVSTTPAHHLLGSLHLLKVDKNAGLNRTSTFHHKLFRYYDVIVALSLGRRPLTGSLTYQDESLSTTRGINATTSTDPYGCVDNVFGLAVGLWPLLHRLAQLSRLSDPIGAGSTTQTSPPGTNSPIFSSSTGKHERISLAALELSFMEWKPHLELYAVNMEHAASDSSLQSLLQNAEAYRYSALIHLYCHCGDSRASPRIQRAVQAALDCCLRVMVFGKPFGGLLWPLFVAGTCTITSSHRNITTTVLDQLLEVQGLSNIAKAKSLLLEVWQHMDAADGTVKWQDAARTLGKSVVLA